MGSCRDVPDERGSIGPAGLDASAAPLVFFAAVDDNSAQEPSGS